MARIKQFDKRTGTTYVYESKSYWDKEKKQSRTKRTLVSRLDKKTGEIVNTDGRGRRHRDYLPEVASSVMPKNFVLAVAERVADARIALGEVRAHH